MTRSWNAKVVALTFVAIVQLTFVAMVQLTSMRLLFLHGEPTA